jgi:hypothetical protein
LVLKLPGLTVRQSADSQKERHRNRGYPDSLNVHIMGDESG